MTQQLHCISHIAFQYGDIVPSDEFYLYLIVAFQMFVLSSHISAHVDGMLCRLMGVVYTTSIFARGFALFTKPQPKKKNKFWERLERFRPKRRQNPTELPI